MRIASLAIIVAAAVLVIGVFVNHPDRASADYNISGQWTFLADGQPPCSAEITETKPQPFDLHLEVTFNCDPPTNVCGTGCMLAGSMNPFTGYFTFDVPSPALTIVSGTVSNGGHSIQGYFYSYCFIGCIPGVVLTPFTATGGDGAPKLGTPTPCLDNCPTFTPTPTPGPVGGVSFEAHASDSAFDTWWLIAIVGASILALGGAALYERRRLAASETDR